VSIDDVAGNGLSRCRSPCRRMTCNSPHEGSKCMPITWRAMSARPPTFAGVDLHVIAVPAVPVTRGLYSFTFQLNASAFCG